MFRRGTTILATLLVACAFAVADSSPKTGVATLSNLELSVRAPPLEHIAAAPANGQVRLRWSGWLGKARCEVSLRALPNAQFGFEEPDDVTNLAVDNWRRSARSRGEELDVESGSLIDGPFGYAPYASLSRVRRVGLSGTLRKTMSVDFVLGILLVEHGCAIEVECTPELTEEDANRILDYLKTVVDYAGPVRCQTWTKDEAKERWSEYASASALKNFRKPIRTRHYIILTNSSGGKLFARKMETNYKTIQKTYPFEEVAGRRLMPVFLFRTNNEYYAFCESALGWPLSQAKASKGHAFQDYYATWYESPNDPTHIHEATHQIFKNRLRLNGGGSWFQEGVAEYIETRKNDRNVVARLVKEGKATGLREFMGLRSLLYSSGVDQRTGCKAHDHYIQAALLIEFLRESRFARDHFLDFVHAVGKVERNDLDAIEQAFRSVYGVGIDELEKEFRQYCKKRR